MWNCGILEDENRIKKELIFACMSIQWKESVIY